MLLLAGFRRRRRTAEWRAPEAPQQRFTNLYQETKRVNQFILFCVVLTGRVINVKSPHTLLETLTMRNKHLFFFYSSFLCRLKTGRIIYVKSPHTLLETLTLCATNTFFSFFSLGSNDLHSSVICPGSHTD